METNFYSVLKKRRSIYGLLRKASVPDSRIEEILKDALLYTPSPFNAQSGRIVLLLNASHDEFWDALTEILGQIAVSPEAFEKTKEKTAAFKNAYGTVLFFEDQAVIQGLQEQFPLYREKFPEWSLNAAGMLQYAVWTSFAAEGMGASLQHYNPLIDEWVRNKTGAPESWRLSAQMPFGAAAAPAGEKSIVPLEQRFRVFS